MALLKSTVESLVDKLRPQPAMQPAKAEARVRRPRLPIRDMIAENVPAEQRSQRRIEPTLAEQERMETRRMR